eukprot:TRINITY_DN8442_c0_g1_i1.p1 TRINITY_DN8442_c0_g1~~TRINITY_DN8442_c0_g1_i1.p1  ORF type:complete len:246 (+),score=126.46 TRINITY_DN8442_c0_g1_i1:54-740(+)
MADDAKIRYAVIANWGAAQGKPQLLSEVSSCTVTNAPNITKIILEKIRGDDHRLTYTYNKFLFHYIVSDRICYLCMADEAMERRIPFAFLEDVMEKFKQKYKDRWTLVTTARELKDFTGELNKRMEVANSGEEDTIRKIKKNIDETKEIMNKNIDELLTRGEKIDILMEKSTALESGATQFRSSARNLKWAMWKRKMCMIGLVVFILLVVIFIIVLIACGGFKFEKCK